MKNWERIAHLIEFGLCLLIILMASGYLFNSYQSSEKNLQTKNLMSSQLETELKRNDVRKFTIHPSMDSYTYHIIGYYRHAKTLSHHKALIPSKHVSTSKQLKVRRFKVNVLIGDGNMGQILNLARKHHTYYTIKNNSSQQSSFPLTQTIMILLLIALLVVMNRKWILRSGWFRSWRKRMEATNQKTKHQVTFKDVAGEDAEKQELAQVVNFLKHPKVYRKLGAVVPHGVLLEGPPGTGKTLLARAVAGEANVPFFSLSGSDFDSPFAGVGVRRIKRLFRHAKQHTPSIIFIDEIDAVGRKRGNDLTGGGAELDSDRTLNELLVEMDGFHKSKVIVLAATNRADVLDSALLRPGRFDRKIYIGRPDVRGRYAILKIHAKNKPLTKDVDLKEVARQTPGFVGADLANLLNEAALTAASKHEKKITKLDVSQAEDRVIAGPPQKNAVINPHDEKIVAIHEAGHTIVGLALNQAMVVRKVTIVPHGRAGGYTLALPRHDIKLISKQGAIQQLAGLLGGRVAEEVIFHVKSSGASNDFKKASNLAHTMITKYGMSNILGDVSLNSQGARQKASYSENTARQVDNGVKRLLNQAHQLAYQVIQTHRKQHYVITKALLKRKTLDAKQIHNLYRHGKC